jgi:7-cyano-7-deazaguanine reductase
MAERKVPKKADRTLRYGEKAVAEARLEPWPNPSPDREYTIDITFPEFSCLCPRSGYPDFATIRVRYVPDKTIVELRSLKLYLNQFRNQYISHEASINRIYDDLRILLTPRWMEVVGDWNPRGNVKTVIRVASDENPVR